MPPISTTRHVHIPGVLHCLSLLHVHSKTGSYQQLKLKNKQGQNSIKTHLKITLLFCFLFLFVFPPRTLSLQGTYISTGNCHAWHKITPLNPLVPYPLGRTYLYLHYSSHLYYLHCPPIPPISDEQMCKSPGLFLPEAEAPLC